MLEQERQQIDQIDQQIVQLFEQRMKVVESIAVKKKEAGIAIVDEKREEAVLEKITNYLKDPNLAPHLEEWYQALFTISRQRQK